MARGIVDQLFDLSDSEVFDELVKVANSEFDGHFTVMKFTTNWRIMFGTPFDREDITNAPSGDTFRAAATSALIRKYSGMPA